MESVFAQAASPRWFQLYIYKDREITRELVNRAEAAGAEAIVLTVDAPGLGTRERDMRNRFTLPAGLAVENLAPLGKEAAAVGYWMFGVGSSMFSVSSLNRLVRLGVARI